MQDKHRSLVRVSLTPTSAGWMQLKVEHTLNPMAPGHMASDHLRCVAMS